VIPFAFAMIAVRHIGHAFSHASVALGLKPPQVESERAET
jgi:hypothetical protein